MIDRDRMVKRFCELVSIDSPSGKEEAIAVELTRRLEALGLGVIRDGYGNLIASDCRPDPFLLSAHMDTVEPGRGIKPAVEGDRIVSDGTTILGGDCKAGITAILEALESLKEDGTPRIAVEVVITREEEVGLVGAHKLDFSKISAREAIVFDGEGPVSRITSASPSYVVFDIQITGRSAHAGMEPENGLSAIRVAAELISKLPNGRIDEETTFNIGTIEGGNVRNAVPDRATIKGEFRSISRESLDSVMRQLIATLDQVRRMFPEAVIEDDIHAGFTGYAIADDDPVTQRVKTALLSLGLKPTMRPSGGGSDGNVFRLKGISSVVVGMSDHNMHTLREFVTVPDLVDAARLCETLLKA